WTKFAEADTHGIGPTLMAHSIRCSEKWAAFTPAEVAREGVGSYLLGWSLSEVERYALVCKYVPHGETPEGLALQPHSQKPVLLFNGEWDILDPPENVAGAQELWKNSLSLTIPGQSHEISDMYVVLCIGPITRDFIDHASADELDTACLAGLQPPSFRTTK
ncbi:MAG: hypothetical protein EHM33_30390, partial [Chloroflexi bacterium]